MRYFIGDDVCMGRKKQKKEMSYDPEMESKGIEPLTSSMLRMRSTPNSFQMGINVVQSTLVMKQKEQIALFLL
jgi:hypothetical protein